MPCASRIGNSGMSCDIIIKTGEKFALIALPKVNVVETVTQVSLGGDFFALKNLPFSVADDWQRWIGEIRAKELQDAGLFLLTKAKANRPADLDIENQLSVQQVSRLFDGLILAETPACSARPFLLTGAHVNGDVSIRQMFNLQCPVRYTFTQSAILRQIDEQALRLAAALTAAVTAINETDDYRRLKRPLSAFFVGIHQGRFDERLHQFCRCIDGIILSRRGKGEVDFTARTRLFIGDDHRDVMKEIYRMRSAVEHLRPAESEVTDKTGLRERRLCVIERALQAEVIARHVL